MPNIERVKAEIEEIHRAQEMLREAKITTVAAVPIEQLVEMYERFCRLTRLGQTSVEDFGKVPEEVMSLRHKIFTESDFGALFAGQWLPKEVRAAARERLRET